MAQKLVTPFNFNASKRILLTAQKITTKNFMCTVMILPLK